MEKQQKIRILIFFLLAILIIFIKFVSADIISINYYGSNKSVLNPHQIIEGFFSSADTTKPLINFTSNTPLNDTNISINSFYVEISGFDLYELKVVFTLYNDVGSYNISSMPAGTRNITYLNLPDGKYHYNVSMTDYSGNFNSTETRTIRIATIPPQVIIASPQAQNYGNNNSINVNVSVIDNIVGTKYCSFFVLNNSNGALLVQYNPAPCNQNLTIKLPGGDYGATLYYSATDNLYTQRQESVSFGIRTIAPAVSIFPANDTHTNYTANNFLGFLVTSRQNISACSLYHNISGAFIFNQTYVNPANNTQINFSALNIPETEFIFNVNCSDIFGNKDWGFSNYSYAVDLTFPVGTIDYITQSGTTNTFNFNATITDKHSTTCHYTIRSSIGTIDGLSDHVSYACNNDTSATTTGFGTYNLSIDFCDKAGNCNQTSQVFTMVSGGGTPGGAGGGGGRNLVPVIAIIQPKEDTATYTPVQRAILYSSIKDVCSNNTKLGNCSLSQKQLSEFSLQLKNIFSFNIAESSIGFWINNFLKNKIENIQIDSDIANKFKLSIFKVVVTENELVLNPSRIDTPKFLISGDLIDYKVRANLELKSCNITEGDTGFSCEITADSSRIIYRVSETGSFQTKNCQVKYTSISGKTAYLSVTFRIVKMGGILIIGIFAILVIILFALRKIIVKEIRNALRIIFRRNKNA